MPLLPATNHYLIKETEENYSSQAGLEDPRNHNVESLQYGVIVTEPRKLTEEDIIYTKDSVVAYQKLGAHKITYKGQSFLLVPHDQIKGVINEA